MATEAGQHSDDSQTKTKEYRQAVSKTQSTSLRWFDEAREEQQDSQSDQMGSHSYWAGGLYREEIHFWVRRDGIELTFVDNLAVIPIFISLCVVVL